MSKALTEKEKYFIGNASTTKKARLKDLIISRFVFLNGILAIVALLLIFAFLVKDGVPAFRAIGVWEMLSGRTWDETDMLFGMLPLISGSFVVTLGAVIVAIPLGIACAIYIAEIAPKRVREILKPAIEVLAGIPSVVIGFIGLTILAPVVAKSLGLATGVTAFTASIMLAFMALPTIISISEDAIVAVPKAYRDGSLALGATKWETISRVVFPAARSGVIAACMLGVGRAVGETMTVLMVAGNAFNIPQASLGGWIDFFLGPVRTMTAVIAAETGEAVQFSLHYHSLFAVGLTLFAITFIINLVADLALKKSRH